MLEPLKSLGSLELAHEVAQKTETTIPAYQQFLQDHGFNNPVNFHERPLMEKTNYIDKYDYHSLLIPNKNNIVSFHRSSGFSKKSTYWPAMNQEAEFLPHSKTVQNLQALYDIENKTIMHVIAFSLGSWVGGDSISAALKTTFSKYECPSMVYSPGNDYRDCIETMMKFQNNFDLFIIYITPSSISDLLMMAESLKQTLPLNKIKFMIGGEMFPESLRTQLYKKVDPNERHNMMISLYGSADTGVMGMESRYSATTRQILQNDTIRSKLGLTDGLPLLHHQYGDKFFAESIDGQIVMTVWQGIPLVRYNLKDRVDFFSWKNLKERLLSYEELAPEYKAEFEFLKKAPDQLPDVIAIYGRADRGVIISGSNISENILNQAIRSSVEGLTDGKYQAEVIYGKYDNQRLSITIEVSDLKSMTPEINKKVQMKITKQFCELQNEFAYDHEKRFSAFDDDPERSIITVTFVQWPYFSEKNARQVKHRVVS